MSDKVNSRLTRNVKNRLFDLVLDNKRSFKNDVLSGLTVALALIPEAIAFSFVAHVNPQIGLFAAFMMAIITSVIGGRPGMISGSTGAIAVIFAPLVIEVTSAQGMDAALAHLFVAVILMGLFQVLSGVFRFGKFVRLIPHPVMLGFVNGLAIVIFRAQFGQFYVGKGATARLLDAPVLAAMGAMIVLTMAICHFLPKFKLTKSWPATLIAIVVVSLLSIFVRSTGIEVRTVLDFVQNLDPSITSLEASLPEFNVPDGLFSLGMIKTVLPYAFLAAIVGLVESLLTLTLVDELTGTRGRSNKECIGQGIANITNGFFGGMGGCAMIGQSMINVRSGGRGRLSGVTAGVALLMFIMFGSSLVEKIPLAALVGVMFMVVIATFEWTSLRILHRIPKADAIIIVLVSVTTVLVDLAAAVILGIVVSALVFAWEHGKKIHATKELRDGLKVYTLEGPLFFGSVASFKELFDIANDPKDVVIDFTNSRVCDHSALEALNNITERYAEVDTKLHLMNLSKECSQLLARMDNVVELSVIEDLEWHLADDLLD